MTELESPQRDIDPYTYGYSGAAMSPGLRAARRYLETGKWHSGEALLLAIGRSIEDGIAYRWTQENIGDTSKMTKEQMVARGRRHLAKAVLRPQLDREFFETRPDKLTKSHWAGKLPWEIRDRYAGAMSTRTVAAKLGITEELLSRWIRSGDVPTPPRSKEGSPFIVTPAIMAVLERMRPHWNGRRWDVEPQGLWNDKAAGTACPHCGGPLVVEVNVGAPYQPPPTEPDPEPVASDVDSADSR